MEDVHPDRSNHNLTGRIPRGPNIQYIRLLLSEEETKLMTAIRAVLESNQRWAKYTNDTVIVKPLVLVNVFE
jgi:hypothetical protein